MLIALAHVPTAVDAMQMLERILNGFRFPKLCGLWTWPSHAVHYKFAAPWATREGEQTHFASVLTGQTFLVSVGNGVYYSSQSITSMQARDMDCPTRYPWPAQIAKAPRPGRRDSTRR